MENIPDYVLDRQKAIQQYEGAYHLFNVTFPLVKDPKLLIGVISNISESLEKSMDAILKYERTLRLVPHYQEEFQSKFNIFRYKSVRRNKIPGEIINLILELRETLALQKRSPMEFQRGNRFVICTKDYQMKVISIKELQNYMDLNKRFINIMETVIKNKL